MACCEVDPRTWNAVVAVGRGEVGVCDKFIGFLFPCKRRRR